MAETTNKKTTFDTYGYKLVLGFNIEDSDKTLTSLSLTTDQGQTVTISNTDYTVKLQGVKFTRKIYEPGLIEAEVAISPVPTVDIANELFNMRYAELHINDTTKDDKTDEKKEDAGEKEIATIATNYFVYMVNPQIIKNNNISSMYVKLTIHSMDKLMTLDKYSQVYTARKLGDILNYESRTFGFSKTFLKTNNYYLRNLRYPVTGNVKDLADNSIKLETSLEFIQPYLVQYNETFYDFMVRTANRCGEFLLFENGTLYLGLPTTETVESIPTYYSITFQDYSKNPLSIKTYARDSVKDGNGHVMRTGLNDGIIKKDSAGFPKDAFTDGLAYNSELAQDEYIYPLYRHAWSNLRHEVGINDTAGYDVWDYKSALQVPIPIIFSLLKAELQNTKTYGIANLIDWGIAFGSEWAQLVMFGAWDVGAKIFNNSWDYHRPMKDKPEQYDFSHTVHFGTLREEGWTTVNYYADVRQRQEQQQKKIICIDMGTSYVDVKLGETITVEGLTDTYVVIEIRLIAKEVWTHDYKRFGLSERATDKYSDRQSQIIYAIPTYKEENKYRAMPPVAPVSIIRKAGPQTAFVVDNKDPKHQGRVRIAYPWQSPTSAKRLELSEAEEQLDLAQQAVSAAERRIQELKDLLSKLKAENKTLDSLKGLSDDEKKTKATEIGNEIAELDTEIKALELPEEDSETTLTIAEYGNRIAQQVKLKRLKTKKEALKTAKKLLEGGSEDVIYQAMSTLKQKIKAYTDELLTKAKDAQKQAEENVKKKKEEVDAQTKEWTGDLKDISSPWVRVATPMATKGGGTYFKPQVGDEVLVNYDNNNIERPYVVGSLFSKNVPDPDQFLNCTVTKSSLLKEATTTIMSPNGHHIAFKDPTDGTEFVKGVQPALGQVLSWANSLTDIEWGKDCTGGIHIGDRYGIYELSMSSHDRKINISSPMGDVSIDAFSGITLSAPNGNVKIVGKNVSIEAGNNIEITSGNNIQYLGGGLHPIGKYKATNLLKSALVGVVGAVSGAVADYFDLTLARTMAEVLLRPIEGTNCIKSKRYLMLEAGKGKAHIPQNRYADTKENEVKEQQEFFNNVMLCVEAINNRCDNFVKRYKVVWDDACMKVEKWDLYKMLIKDDQLTDLDPLAKGWDADPDNEWKNPFTEENFKGKTKQINQVIISETFHYDDEEKRIQKLVPIANECAKAVYMVHRQMNKFEKLFDQGIEVPDNFYNLLKDDFNKKKSLRIDAWKEAYLGNDKPNDNFAKSKTDDMKDDPIFHKMKGFKRYLAALFILHVAKAYPLDSTGKLAKVKAIFTDPMAVVGAEGKYLKIHYTENDLKEERLELPYYWHHFVDNMRKFDKWYVRAIWDAFASPWQTALQLTQEKTGHSDKVYKTAWQQISDRKVWNDRPDGLILLSDRKDMTRAFDSGKWKSSTMENRGNWDYLTEYLLRYMK